jgi:hypothetical protein
MPERTEGALGVEWFVVLVVIVTVLALGLRLWTSGRGKRRRAGSLTPVERRRAEEEVRRRHGGSGGTVDGGQHLR